jgi:hypothetical protein
MVGSAILFTLVATTITPGPTPSDPAVVTTKHIKNLTEKQCNQKKDAMFDKFVASQNPNGTWSYVISCTANGKEPESE